MNVEGSTKVKRKTKVFAASTKMSLKQLKKNIHLYIKLYEDNEEQWETTKTRIIFDCFQYINDHDLMTLYQNGTKTTLKDWPKKKRSRS